MNDEARVAFINSQVVCASITAMGMMAENEVCRMKGVLPEYYKEDFDKLINEYGIHHNAVIGYLR